MSDISEDEATDDETTDVERSEIERHQGEELKILPRNLWDPQDSPRPMDRMKYPLKAVYWTNSQSKPCYNQKQCLRRIRELQEFHLKGGMFDIPFNFLVGGDCKIYEGRGWDWGCLLPYTRRQIIDMYKHPYQNCSLVIAYIGKTLERDLNHPMVQAGDRLVDYARDNNMIIPGFETIVKPYWVAYAKNMFAAEADVQDPGRG
ncbi:peptidoglycan-recognition protein LF-like [Macrosteles quadrilineatus]|uniref:peptidoglycan-recognition protein LF-like n=1 Tax=Macrosteles quadrilineatus TaxID=74068 RepID=UPI0023E18481|nr:peptidoglycan-recognition protein LF-like [Macrosteles quadrilineatus]